MAAKVLITGGSGLVGSYLSEMLTTEGFEVSHLSRSIRGTRKYTTFQWDVRAGELDEAALQVDHIIHLAGAGVADERWTDRRKKEIYDSRIQSTALLYSELAKHQVKLKSFVAASAIGLYGTDTGDELLHEASASADDFLAEVVKDWEKEALKIEALDIPVARIRIGVVLAREGGALAKIAQPVRWGVGAPLGNGKQYISWIHIKDLCRIFHWALTEPSSDVFNATAPTPVTNAELTRKIANVLKRPLFLPPVPAFAMKLMLGEMASIVLGGNNVSSQRLVDAGFKFEFTQAEEAIADLLA
ncbi:MAG: TIGR01777 family oxidoreductase [Bacteroidota bacterium]